MRDGSVIAIFDELVPNECNTWHAWYSNRYSSQASRLNHIHGKFSISRMLSEIRTQGVWWHRVVGWSESVRPDQSTSTIFCTEGKSGNRRNEACSWSYGLYVSGVRERRNSTYQGWATEVILREPPPQGRQLWHTALRMNRLLWIDESPRMSTSKSSE